MGNDKDTTGYPKFDGDHAAKVLAGEVDCEVVNYSAADATPVMTNNRGIRADGSSSGDGYFTIKVLRRRANGTTFTETLTLTIGQIHPISNIILVYRYTTGTTAGTSSAWVVSGASSETSTLTAACIKLVR
jgi:hypothetical protein